MIFVKVAKLGKVNEYALKEGSSLNDLLVIAGLQSIKCEEIRINGQYVGFIPTSYILRDKDVLTIVDKKMLRLRVAKIGQPLKELNVSEGYTVNQVLMCYHVGLLTNEEVWVHYDGIEKGQLIGLHERVRDGMILILERKKETLNDKVEKYLSDRYHIISNKLYTDGLIALIKNG